MGIKTFADEYDTGDIASMVVFINDLKKHIEHVKKILAVAAEYEVM